MTVKTRQWQWRNSINYYHISRPQIFKFTNHSKLPYQNASSILKFNHCSKKNLRCYYLFSNAKWSMCNNSLLFIEKERQFHENLSLWNLWPARYDCFDSAWVEDFHLICKKRFCDNYWKNFNLNGLYSENVWKVKNHFSALPQ